MSRIKVVIPFYKRQDQLDKCKAALVKAEEYLIEVLGDSIEVEVVDNSVNNTGFPAAVNSVARKAIKEGFDYLLVLNQDVYLHSQAIVKMVEFMNSRLRCAIGSIKQLSNVNPDHIVHGGTLECYPAGRHIGGLVSSGDCNENKRMPWANAAAMIVRVDLIPEFGLLDEDMFLIGSDADISLRARARGYEVWYIADAVCTHEQGGVSSSGGENWMQRRMYLDMVAFRSKWIPTDLFRELTLEVFD